MYLIEVYSQRRSGQIDVNINNRQADQNSEERERTLREQAIARQEEEARVRREQEERERERRRAEEEKRRKEEEKQRIQREYEEKAAQNPVGVVVETLTRPKRQELGLLTGVQGVLVQYVEPSSPAHKAGVRDGMIISSVEWRHSKGTSNKTPTSAEYFDNIMKNRKPGENMELSVWRKSEGNKIREGYAGAEQAGKWYRATLRFTIE